MKKILSLLVFVAICCFISACSDEDLLISESEVNSQDLLSTKYDASCKRLHDDVLRCPN